MTGARARIAAGVTAAPGALRPVFRSLGARAGARAMGREVAITMALGFGLTAAVLSVFVLESGAWPRFAVGDIVTAGAAGLVAAGVVRMTVRLHRRWKRTVGRLTASAALCALAGIAGSLVVMIPSRCPGEMFSTGRCGLREATTWGQVAGLATLVNLLVVGLILALTRSAARVVGEGSAQGLIWIRKLGGLRRRRLDVRASGAGHRPAGSGRAKVRPTPRRADVEQARRARLRPRR